MAWGGKRSGAGRKPRAAAAEPAPPAEPLHPDLSPEQMMERGMRELAAEGDWAKAARIARDILLLDRARPTPAGKKQHAADLAQALAGDGGRFAPRPPPKLN